MYEYFGVGPYLLEDVDDMYPRFLRWLPKYHLSEPPKRSLQAWCIVINSLATNDVSFFCCCLFLWFCVFVLCCLASFHSGLFVVFKCL